ncbi:hypothetical protein J7E73_14930 [Paenibacillus albidus]|uniref:TOTE conflict system archaeo-eukaryotic primase domain-containing protein n=1 Tax=Paenibacillus albidus TaxID=2041023 RepID=UPI001BEBEA90|nr:hypothetical protein [Paenibacillus albidus]MBT2290412.1 hypothetical protein [Paenibacillus albidus]
MAIDFDKHEWQQVVTAIMQICKSYAIPTALEERSCSGNSGHIWIFFSQVLYSNTQADCTEAI